MKPRSTTKAIWPATCWLVEDAQAQSQKQQGQDPGEPMLHGEQALPRERYRRPAGGDRGRAVPQSFP